MRKSSPRDCPGNIYKDLRTGLSFGLCREKASLFAENMFDQASVAFERQILFYATLDFSPNCPHSTAKSAWPKTKFAHSRITSPGQTCSEPRITAWRIAALSSRSVRRGISKKKAFSTPMVIAKHALRPRALVLRMIFCLFFLSISLPMPLAQWIELSTGTSMNLNAVHFLDSNYGVVVGDQGTVLLTENAGLSWGPIGNDLVEDLRSVLIWDRDTILVSGQDMGQLKTYRTSNGGATWSSVNEAVELARIANRLLSCGYDDLDWSDDQGQSWTPSGTPIGGTTLLSHIAIANSETAIASGNVSGFANYSFYGFRTTNQGQQWDPLYVFDLPNANAWTTSSYPHPDTLLLFTNEQVNFLPGPKNTLVRLTGFYFDTQNGMESWRFDSETLHENLPTYTHDAAFVNAQMGYIVGENGHVYRTTDGGREWVSIYTGNEALRAMALIDREIAYVVGDNGLVLKNENLTSLMNPVPMDQLKIWPNPTTDGLSIRGIDQPSTQMFLYDMSGRLLQSWTWHQGEAISLQQLPKGQYQLSVQLKRQRLTYPILKQ